MTLRAKSALVHTTDRPPKSTFSTRIGCGNTVPLQKKMNKNELTSIIMTAGKYIDRPSLGPSDATSEADMTHDGLRVRIESCFISKFSVCSTKSTRVER